LALGIEPAERNIMKRPPISINENIFARGMGQHILWIGLLMGAVSLGAGYWGWAANIPTWTTITFTTLTLAQMGHALAIRSDIDSLFKQGIFSNKALLGAVLLTFLLQMLVIYWPPLQEIFETQALNGLELGISLGLSLAVFIAVEIEKWFKRRNLEK
jgi:Ca2+-transporting ATPase